MSEDQKPLRLYNTLTRMKEEFSPIDRENVRMYVCGPTVYDFAHIGNARPVIVFDVLFRLLNHIYGADHVTYVRNITDVDDKINARALRDFGDDIASGALSLNEAIRRVTEKTADQFHKDVKALGCLPPTFEPRATEFVQPREDGKTDMISLIQSLIERGHAYVAKGEVLFDTASMSDYGQLSKRPLDEQQAGARIAVDAHKKSPQDFVLWKLSSPEEPGWESPWGRGRPGWHIECSAMSSAYLDEEFDIHGGGLDLIFPHHENEIAQSRCAHGTPTMANVWMHNGFLQVEGQKMSKSLGNFYSINQLLETDTFGGRKWPGEVLRLAMLMTHYREPIDFSVSRLKEARAISFKWVDLARRYGPADGIILPEVLDALHDDLNTPLAIQAIQRGKGKPSDVAASVHFLNLFEERVVRIGETRRAEQKAGIRKSLQSASDSVVLSELGVSREEIEAKINERLALIADKNWTGADRIRDELLAQGIQLKDGKDPSTGERITTWEVKR